MGHLNGSWTSRGLVADWFDDLVEWVICLSLVSGHDSFIRPKASLSASHVLIQPLDVADGLHAKSPTGYVLGLHRSCIGLFGQQLDPMPSLAPAQAEN
ncbi:hypothetical protein NL676_022947 [Syzygium grande]|nr:hypothetical protein NL676_022947 [Syzygium grande]